MIGSAARDAIPTTIALIVCCGALFTLIRLSGLSIKPARLRSLKRDERGGVQSLAFVLTFPIFLLLVMFIIQLSQLLIAIVIVNYAAFASARAASVWIPTRIQIADGTSAAGTAQNQLPDGIAAGQPFTLSQSVVDSFGNRKYREIWTAAALACVPISPSRTLPGAPAGTSSTAQGTTGSLVLLIQSLDPSASQNNRLGQRIGNKVTYSFSNTTVDLRFDDRSSVATADGIATYNPIGHPSITHNPSEVGWQDPLAVTVRHRFALLPGPARWLAAGVANRDGRIIQENGVYKTTLSATITMTVEGLQSLRPTLHSP